MSFQMNAPPSVVTKLVKSELNAEGEPKKQSREEWKKMKELEEMRKAGTAPAMQDEEGKDINPHIPQYIMQAPWYYGANAPTLRHQRPQEEEQSTFARMKEWYKRGVKEGPVATKFRKGACENCGAMTHKKKDCMERPRKVGAKFTSDKIAPDEYIQVCLSHDYDGKRDRWNGADLEEHQNQLYSEYEKIEEAKRILKGERLDESMLKDKEGDSDNEDKYAEEMDMPGQKFETKQRITVRNLRIREDTAKYLYNLDPNSAYYDPKTRSMRENPFKTNPSKDGANSLFVGDNFVRGSGDANDMASQQMFAWDAFERGTDVHLQADPTKLELLQKEYHKRKDNYKKSAKDSILDKYGGEEHLQAPPRQLLLAQTEDYVEYSRHGTVVKGMERIKVKSRYEEDVYVNNHSSVWGSFWQDGRWGFACCHAFIKESYCTGEAGRESQEAGTLIPIQYGHVDAVEAQEQEEEEEEKKSVEKKKKKKKEKKKKKRKKKKRHYSSSSSSESESEDDETKLKKALQREEDHKRNADRLLAMDERKRPYNSMFDAKAPTEEEMEAWRMKRQREEDPMAGLL